MRRFAAGRCIVETGSQDDAGFLSGLAAKYQPAIIIDDGSHIASHILLTFETLFPHLLPGGTYIVEDIHFHTGESARSFQAYFLDLAGRVAFNDMQIAADERFVNSIDTVEFWHGGVAIRKQPPAESDRFADKRRLVAQADLPEIWGSFAMYLLRHNGNAAEAVSAARRAVELKPSEPVLHHYLGMALDRAGDVPGAIGAARMAVALDPEFVLFRESLAALLKQNVTLKGAAT